VRYWVLTTRGGSKRWGRQSRGGGGLKIFVAATDGVIGREGVKDGRKKGREPAEDPPVLGTKVGKLEMTIKKEQTKEFNAKKSRCGFIIPKKFIRTKG